MRSHTRRLLIGLGIWLLYGLSGWAQRPEVHWMSFAQLEDSMRLRPKPVLVHIHTSWCGYCRLQEAQTYRNREVVQRLNESFYALKLDAESRQPLRFDGQLYPFAATGPGAGTHTLAVALGKENGTLAYPTVVVLDARYQILFRQVGFRRAGELLPLLQAVRSAPPE